MISEKFHILTQFQRDKIFPISLIWSSKYLNFTIHYQKKKESWRTEKHQIFKHIWIWQSKYSGEKKAKKRSKKTKPHRSPSCRTWVASRASISHLRIKKPRIPVMDRNNRRWINEFSGWNWISPCLDDMIHGWKRTNPSPQICVRLMMMNNFAWPSPFIGFSRGKSFFFVPHKKKYSRLSNLIYSKFFFFLISSLLPNLSF